MNSRRRVFGPMSLALSTGLLIAVTLWSAGIFDREWFAGTPDEKKTADEPHLPPLEPAAPVVPPGETEVSRLHLVSTSPGRNAFEGTATLGTSIANAQVIAAGALLENGTMLREIHANHVVLERDGKRAYLYVEGVAAPANSKAAKPTDTELLSLTQQDPVFEPVPASDPTYTEILRGAPHFVNDQLAGFVVFAGTVPGHFSRLGLHPGDVLLAIDGTPLTSQQALSSSLGNLSRGRSVTASLVRAGQRVDVALDGALLIQHVQTTASAEMAPPR